MKSNTFRMMVFVLMILPLWSCRWNVSEAEIPVTGGETSTPINTVESDATLITTQENQSLPEATMPSPTNLPKMPTCQTPVVTIKSNHAYLRDGPDLRFVTIAQYENGDELTMVGRYKDWFQVESSDGIIGWLYKDWLSLPSNIDESSVCSILEQDVPMITQDSKKPRQDEEEKCVPSYYDSCP